MLIDAGPFDSKLLAEQDAVLASDPDNVAANYNKGIILLNMCRSKEALEYFERVLKLDPSCARAWIGKGRALTMQGDYDGAEECFGAVPEDDADYHEAQSQSARNRRYKDRRGHAQATGPESDDEKMFNDELEWWMGMHLDRIRNLRVLLHKFRCARDGCRRKEGNVFHASLVRLFYEYEGPLKVVAVERGDIEPKTDVDIELSGDIYIQAWRGKMPLGYTIDGQLQSGDSTPLDVDWCEELKPVEKKLQQLPSTGKGFVINYVPGIAAPPIPPLHHLCDERKCVMTMMAFEESPHVIVTGTSDFKYRDEACQIARMLERPVRFILGDWDELREQGRSILYEAAFGVDLNRYTDLLCMRYCKQDLLSYAKNTLKLPACDDLAKLGREELYRRLWTTQLLIDSDCQDD